MKTVIFDLDYTLFDAKKFREECLAPFFGMSDREFEQAYQKNKATYGNFDHQVLLAELGLAESAFDECLKKDINKYFFPGAEKLLDAYRRHADTLVLATFGNIGWQRKKISFLRIGKQVLAEVFDEIILENKNKAGNEALKALPGDEIEIINDNEEESQRLLEFFGSRAKLRLIKGPYSKIGYRSLTELGSEIFPEAYYNVDSSKINKI